MPCYFLFILLSSFNSYFSYHLWCDQRHLDHVEHGCERLEGTWGLSTEIASGCCLKVAPGNEGQHRSLSSLGKVPEGQGRATCPVVLLSR